jgi:cytochrome c5
MSEQHTGTSKTTPSQFIIAILAGFAAPIIAIVLIVQLVMSIQQGHIDKDSPAMAEAAVAARLKPVAEVKTIDPNAPRVERTGEQIYSAVCTNCHQAGALGAPKFGNKGDWSKRIAQGFDTLIKHATEGIRQMPARGGDPEISDVELARAVAYMADAAGAKFKPKEPVAAAPAPAKTPAKK